MGALVAVLYAAAGCAATANPERSASSRSGGASERSTERSDRSGEWPVVGRVGERQIPVEDFLARLWLRDNATARDLLEQLVLAELALREAARLGLEIDSDRVEILLAGSEAALLERLATGSSPALTIDQHVRQNLRMDPGFYRSQLRADALVQLVAERCVRAHTLGSPRVRTRVLDLEGAAADAARAAFEAGEGFAAVAAGHGGDDELVLVRSETNDLARLAFATELGQVGGPLIREGQHVWLAPLERLEPVEEGGGWERIGERVEASLKERPVGDPEFVQWRHRMVDRYAVDLGPFLELVGDKGP